MGIQICEALHYMHLKQLIHRDVKPQNILISGDREGIYHRSENGDFLVKLADFGGASVRDDPLNFCSNQLSTTPSYHAPEVR